MEEKYIFLLSGEHALKLCLSSAKEKDDGYVPLKVSIVTDNYHDQERKSCIGRQDVEKTAKLNVAGAVLQPRCRVFAFRITGRLLISLP